MDFKELQNKNPEELRRLASELRTQIRGGRFHVTMRQTAKLKGLREAKKDLARLETLLNAKRA